ncbi:MAG: GAF domain-containing protein [Deltaproteobacteria bacterium]|nr:GAF domain-containing protein [Deltaproteobacteria bacterium]
MTKNRVRSFVSRQLASYRKLIDDEMHMPDFKGRHLFTARLRIILFLGTWMVFFVFFPAIWKLAPLVPLVFNCCFLITSFCYLIVVRHNKIFLSVIFLEVAADILSQTALIYIVGVDGWLPFLIYGLYITAVGILSGYNLALIASTLALISYYIVFVLIHSKVIPEFVYSAAYTGLVDLTKFHHYVDLVFLPLSFVIIVYSVRIANFFTKIKENILERRNLQLTALNHIGATIRHALHVQKVINEILKAVIQGLGFEVCFLAMVDTKGECVRFFLPEGNYYTIRIEEMLGEKYANMYLPLDVRHNSTFMAIKRNRVLVRNNFSELMYGIKPDIPMHNTLRVQKVLEFKKFVITPLVAEHRVVGAIIGASKKPFIEDTVIDTLDNFANQAALALESAQLIETLEQKNKELIKADKMKSDFLAIMSHELRTPLNAVLGYTECLLDKSLGEINADQAKSLKEVLLNGENLLGLINNILDLAKIESGKMVLHIDSFDLVELIEGVKTSLVPLIDKKKQVCTIHKTKTIPLIKADAVKMRQVITNLLGNAIKFTNKNGEIDVFIEYYDDSEEICTTDFKNEKIPEAITANPSFVLRIRDNGVGIKETDRAGIFELFNQADSSYTRKHEGTGLGLALTKQLVTLHSGYIVLDSEYGEGSEFKILIPQLEVMAS